VESVCKPENQPAMCVRMVVVDRLNNGGSVARVQVLMRDGAFHSLMDQHWPGHRPSPGQLDDLVAAVATEIADLVVGTRGVQGIIT
jgi:hypothetical protein